MCVFRSRSQWREKKCTNTHKQELMAFFIAAVIPFGAGVALGSAVSYYLVEQDKKEVKDFIIIIIIF